MAPESPAPFIWNHCGICGKALAPADDGQSTRPYCADCNRFYYLNPIPAACCFVRRNFDELLFVQRAVEPSKGEWTLPGGFMELGESSEECALRELHEETNLRGSGARLIGASTRQSPDSGAIMVLGYVVESWHGEADMRADTDAMALGFFSKHERPAMAFSVHRELLGIYDALTF